MQLARKVPQGSNMRVTSINVSSHPSIKPNWQTVPVQRIAPAIQDFRAPLFVLMTRTLVSFLGERKSPGVQFRTPCKQHL
jgi:hypothetical protein